MKTEIEVKFLNVDFDNLRNNLTRIGAECVKPMREMRRRNYDFAGRTLSQMKNGWVRLRDEGDGVITMCYKQQGNRDITGTKEVCVVVDNFETTNDFLVQIGLQQTSDQTTRRESWKFGDCQIELDEWPWAKPSVEIEGDNESALRDLAESLGLDWSVACFGSGEIVYTNEYNVTESDVNSWPKIIFGPVPEWLEAKRK